MVTLANELSSPAAAPALPALELLVLDPLPLAPAGDASRTGPDTLSSRPHIDESQNLGEAFQDVACACPQAPAMVSHRGMCRYEALGRAASLIADRLQERDDFQPGDRVALLLGNSAEYAAALYGILLAGGVAVPLPVDTEAGRLQALVQRAGSRVLITTRSVLGRRRDLNLPISTALDLTRDDATLRTRPGLRRGDDLAVILFTSGSTGVPKGVMLSHRNLLANARQICTYLPITPQDRAVAILPFYHAFGNSVLQTHLLCGASLVLEGSLTFPDTILDAIADFGATSFSGVPEAFQLLLRRSSLAERRLPSLKYMAVAGGQLPPDRAREVALHIAPAAFFVMYGQSEATARLAYLPPDQLAQRYGSLGKAIPDVELQVVDAEGRAVPPGTIGELRARGPNVMLGYFDDPEGTKTVLRDGWLSTGDRALADQDGFLYAQGRLSALVKIGGYRVHPRELEEFAAEELGCERAIAVPVETPEFGTRLALFIQCRSGEPITAAAALRVCQQGLPAHKVPVYIDIIDRLPLNDALKLDLEELKRRAQAGTKAPLVQSGDARMANPTGRTPGRRRPS